MCSSSVVFSFSFFMRYIGIDIAKESFDVWIPEPQPEGDIAAGQHLCFPNNTVGFRELLSLLRKNDVVGLESTGRYHYELARYLISKKCILRLLNPLLTKQFTRATIRNKKTDKTDAQIISRLLAQGEGYNMSHDMLNNPLRELSRLRRQLIKQRSSLKIQLKATKHAAAGEVLAETLQALIVSFDQQINILQEQILAYKEDDLALLESIPGISPQLAREIRAEIGDYKRFASKQKLVAYAGYDPKIKRSGTSINHTSSLTKRGSPFLRNALYLAVFANIRHNKTPFARYYRKKRKQGKAHKQAMVATSRKMLETIFALLTKQEYFCLDLP